MKKLLIVVDMQNDFVSEALGSSEAVAIIDNSVKVIEAFDGDIIVTLDTHYDDYMNTREGKFLPVPHCIKGTYGWELNDKILAALEKRNYIKVEKNTFGSTGLPDMVAGKYDEIILMGLCTDICVVSNAMLLKAAFPEIEISVKADCCAGVTVEKHLAALEVMRSCQINII